MSINRRIVVPTKDCINQFGHLVTYRIVVDGQVGKRIMECAVIESDAASLKLPTQIPLEMRIA